MILDKDYSIRCQQVWVAAWIGTAQSDTCTKTTTASEYADSCLKNFKERFKASIDEENKERCAR